MNSNITAAAVLVAFRLAGAHSHHWAQPVTEARLALGRARRDAAQKGEPLPLPDYTNLDWIEEGQGRAPRTAEEADAMGWLPTAIGGGVMFGLSHRTGSGRLGWQIDPASGKTMLTIYRPGDRVVARAVVSNGHVTVDLVRPHEIEVRHAEALAAAINVACDVDVVTGLEVMDEVYRQCPARLRADAMAALRAA